MSKTVVTSQKFSSLEIVDSAKFDNEIVFEDLAMVGTSLDIICSGLVSITSTGTATPWGVDVLSNGPVTISSTDSTLSLLSGFDDGVTPVSGSVQIGHSTGVASVVQLEVLYDSGTDENRIGFFGATPVVQPATPVDVPTIVAALQALGLVA